MSFLTAAKWSMCRSLVWGSLVWGFFAGTPANAERIDIGPTDDWFGVLSGDSLRPGDEVVLSAGVYSDPRLLAIRHRGTAGRPIVIRAAEGHQVIFRRPDRRQNTINLIGNEHLHLSGIEVTGGSIGIRIQADGDRQPSDIVIQDMHVHHVGGPAITCNHPGVDYRRMTFRRNHIHHTSGHGEAFYLGGNDASAILSDSTIQDNYIHDLRGPEVSQGDGIEIKHGSFNNRVVGNVIHDTAYPGVTVYGTRGEAINRIQGNWIWNTGDHGIQAAADADIIQNVVVGASQSGIYSREHQGAVPGRLLIRGNFVADCGGPSVRVIGSPSNRENSSQKILVSGNRLIARDGQMNQRLDHVFTFSASSLAQLGYPDEPPLEPEPPAWSDHPAWKHLDRAPIQAWLMGHF